MKRTMPNNITHYAAMLILNIRQLNIRTPIINCMARQRPKCVVQSCFPEQIYYQSHGQIERSYWLSSLEFSRENIRTKTLTIFTRVSSSYSIH